MPGRKTTTLPCNSFAGRLLKWYEQHGRKDLPWQRDITPYRVWLSEIMLQQTQVATVIPYFERFVEKFPGVEDLANAPEDEVLHLWSGLGYYSRARNLHSAAKIICNEFDGVFPSDLEQLQSLPGIGRSTAGAICASAFQLPTPILDGNVKRVLARHDGIDGWPGKTTVARQLWQCAEKYTPATHARPYTQAIMDLGATLCTRSKPDCGRCPVNRSCVALAEKRVGELPGRKPRKTLPTKQTFMYLLVNADNEVLLEKRPPTGVWGGLWSFPEQLASNAEYGVKNRQHWPVLRHTFSHFHLEITPVLVRSELPGTIMDNERLVWYNIEQPPALGLAAPVSKLLRRLSSEL